MPSLATSTYRRLAVVVALLAGALPAAAQRAEQGAKPVATGDRVMASSSHPRVTRAILDVLADGGNAVDAMLTAIPLQHVIEPQMSTLAGGMGGLIYWAETGELVYLDAELDHTANAQTGGSMARPAHIGTTSGERIGVPGIVPGMQAAMARYGTRDWHEYFGPAIEAAAVGFTMYSFLYGEMAAATGRLGAHAESAAKWMPDGFVPRVGGTVRQPVLAGTLRTLATEGPGYFTSGGWAERFVAAVNRSGGAITVDELANYEPRWAEPLKFSYHGHQLRGAPPASTAGLLNGMIFNILEHLDVASQGHYTESADSLYLIRRAYEQAEFFSASFTGDPRTITVPVDGLLAKDFGRQLAGLIRTSSVEPVASATPIPAPAAAAYSPLMYTDTNHLVIVDAAGNWVSMTHTVYGDTFGTGLTVDGVGVNSGNNFPGTGNGDGRRVITPFPALMAVDGDGKPWLALGSPGLSSRAVALTLINYLDYGMDPYASVDAPRFRGYGRYDELQIEGRVAESVVDGLRDRGVRVSVDAPYNWHMGSIHLVVRDRDTGRLTGVADPRRAGHAAGQ